MLTPDLDLFRTLGADGAYVPVSREYLADELTPVAAFRRLARDERHAFLLESVEGGENIGRYSFLGAGPEAVFRASLEKATIERDGRTETVPGDPFAALEAQLARYRVAEVAGLPRFSGGAVGYVSYDAVRCIERLPDQPPDMLGVPDFYFLLSPTVLVFDHVRKTLRIVTHARAGSDPEAAYAAARARIEAVAARLAPPHDEPLSPSALASAPAPPVPESNFTREAYEKAVERAKEYISAGDIIQVVPSQRFRVPMQADPFDLYRALRVVNPSPYMFYLKLGDTALVGSSPEVMVRVERGVITVRPIAGTRKRGATSEEDAALAAELLADPKEIAEHVMLLDLGRNDVGRASEFGSVEVTEKMVIERYSHVMHIVSNVRGTLREGMSAFDALKSCLPAGTVSGAPKIRAMEIIDELEPEKRGVYAGAVGYFDFHGNLDTCIAIRTVLVKDGIAYVQAGGGVVADSVPASEYEETRNKARGMLAAVALAEEVFGGGKKE